MKTLTRFFIENSKLTIVLTIGMLVYGMMGMKRMNAESYPAVSMATAIIVTQYDGATAADIETKITKPLEDEIRGVSGLKDVKSTSQAGLSTIVVRVDMDDERVDVKEAMNDIQKALDRTTKLPKDLKESPSFVEMKSEEFPVMELAIAGDNTNRARDKIADHLKEELEDNKKVKEIRLVGFAERAFQIKLDYEKLRNYHISIDEVLGQITARNTNTPGGAVKQNISQKLVRIEGKIKSNEELENIVLRANFSGQTIFLKDVASVKDDQEEIKTITRYNGEPSTLLIVTKKAGADTLSLVKSVNEKFESFRKRYPNYKFNIYNNEGSKVKNRLDVLTTNAASGLVLVIIFLLFFLPGKIGLVASLSLPIAVLGTLGFMPMYDMNLDTITILALVIALGMLVDNSVVIAENFTRLRQSGVESKEAAIKSVEKLWLPITATAFTTIAAFVPMLVTKGIMGKFIRFIPIVVTISLLLSLAESFFFLPMRLAWAGKVIKGKNDKGESDWFSKFENKFQNFMEKVIKRRYLVLVGFGALVATSLFFMAVANKFILFPADQTEMYLARIEMKKGTRIEETSNVVNKLTSKVSKVLGEDVIHIVGRAGVSKMRPGDPKAKEGNNVGMVSIYVSEHLKNDVPHTEVLKTLRKIDTSFAKSVTFEALVNGPPVGNAIEATFRSNNMTDLYGLINSVKEELSQTEGILDLRIDDVIGDDEIFINIDYEKASRLGLHVQSIGNTVRTAVSGKRASKVTLNNKDIDLIVRFKEVSRKNVQDLGNIKIMDQRGNLVKLSSFATFEIKNGTPQIKRFDFKRSKTLTGDVNEEIITSMKANRLLQSIFEKRKDQYPGVTLVFGGAAESTKESMDSLFNALILSLIGIFALLVFIFRSYLRPVIIMTTIPLGLLGFSIAFFLHARPVSFMALIGIIGLGGIIVNSGIVLISFIDDLKEEGKLPLDEILIKASGMRLRAVLVTSLTTISGLIPTAYGIGGTDAMLVPMTLAMAWGLTSGTILTLVWVPCAYAILEDFNNLVAKLLNRNNKTEDNSSSTTQVLNKA